jgi:hypothetical protein
MVWWRGASAQAGSCRSLNGDRFVVANPLRRGAGIRRRSPAGPLTEELVVNQSSTVATWNAGAERRTPPGGVLQPGHREGFDLAVPALPAMVTATARTPCAGRDSASARASPARRASRAAVTAAPVGFSRGR